MIHRLCPRREGAPGRGGKGVSVSIVGNAQMSFRPRLPTAGARRNLAQPRGESQIPRRCAARNDKLPTQMTLTHRRA